MYNTRIRGIGLLLVFVFLLVAAVVGIIVYSGQETTNFQGFAESNETIINSETSVSIKKVFVMEGDSVYKGQKLAELESQELSIRIADIRSQLLQIETKRGMSEKEIKSKILQNKAAERAVISELRAQIQTLENQLKINKELSDGLKSVKIKKSASVKNPIEIQIESLELAIVDRKKEFAEINRMYSKMLESGETPENVEAEKLRAELESLEEQNANMAVYAPFDGIVGSVFIKNGNGEKVFFKGGEKIAAYSPILSIVNKEPSFVKGYIPESHFSAIKIGDEVTIANTQTPQQITGIVTGLGGRIIPLPTRLLKNPNIPLWGREIVVKIPENNGFILGEKVSITCGSNVWDNLAKAFSVTQSKLSAKEKDKKKLNKIQDETYQVTSLPKDTIKQNVETFPETSPQVTSIQCDGKVKIEASGAVFVPETGKFLVVSDETEKKTPLLFEVGKNGETKTISINNFNKINDLESIAKERENTYLIMSSLSYSKKGKLKPERRILARITFSDKAAQLEKAVDFYEILKDFAEKSGSEAAMFLKKGIAEKTIDIEGMFVIDNSLFIAFKNPLFNENGVIFEISGYETIFAEKKISENQLKMIFVDVPRGRKISDIYMQSPDKFYYTASCDSEKCGGFYRFENEKSELIKEFPELKPEGIAIDDGGNIFIFFDLSQQENSKFMNLGRI
ncbi:HlyD family efflux transporter periplasmic adaptor subunit [bacterium]|nr:HlyD family efflux transporter periplasmic adaptor subunit [bacterium]